ncbi:hypothetical protein [Lysobacter gummosus]|uniref:hypothetical protein n=1 Tax=Lysobacter gummosus TaxID=262324 RepID=UPI00363736E5
MRNLGCPHPNPSPALRERGFTPRFRGVVQNSEPVVPTPPSSSDVRRLRTQPPTPEG